jgi:hypothetical protein
MAYTKNLPSQRIPAIQASEATPDVLEDTFTADMPTNKLNKPNALAWLVEDF